MFNELMSIRWKIKCFALSSTHYIKENKFCLKLKDYLEDIIEPGIKYGFYKEHRKRYLIVNESYVDKANDFFKRLV